ncbi:hypothetical protein AOX56_00205 [Aeromonas sobria]|uniref:Uncharacterized protein n=1 Tax=Aeromonas sobria TaxID=646 RepID=A0A2N3J8U9_AERSO|nr:hypothetical protein AOX56_00205 [Aeromonas sobria]
MDITTSQDQTEHSGTRVKGKRAICKWFVGTKPLPVMQLMARSFFCSNISQTTMSVFSVKSNV